MTPPELANLSTEELRALLRAVQKEIKERETPRRLL
jgi:hypothetical protein